MQNPDYKPYADGERIYLREIRTDDAGQDYYNWLNDEEINRYTESRFAPQSIEQIRNYIITANADSASVFFAIINKENSRHIGNIKLGGINWKHRYADIGLIIGDKSAWGQGFGSEAIALVADFAACKLNLHKVWAGVYANNLGSLRAFEKAGFEREALLKKHYFCDGAYVDGILLGRILDNRDRVS